MLKRRGLEYWQKHLAARHLSDLTQEAYCASHRLSTKSFFAGTVNRKNLLSRKTLDLGTGGLSMIGGSWKLRLTENGICVTANLPSVMSLFWLKVRVCGRSHRIARRTRSRRGCPADATELQCGEVTFKGLHRWVFCDLLAPRVPANQSGSSYYNLVVI